MTTIIKDGTGHGYTAKVNSANRLFVNAVQIDDDVDAALEGKAFTINIDMLTLTSANESATLYVKNNETEDLLITGIFNTFGTSTGGSGEANIKITRNPTGGTIVSDATSITPLNRNFGNNNALTADTFSGGEGKTLTGGSTIFDFPLPIPTTRATFLTFVVPRGSSIGVSLTPPTGNTSVVISTGLNVHLDGFNE